MYAWCLLSTSHLASSPLAMASRTPVVTTGLGGLGETIEHDKSGITVQPSPASIASGILKVLTDPKHANRLAIMAYDKIGSLYR